MHRSGFLGCLSVAIACTAPPAPPAQPRALRPAAPAAAASDEQPGHTPDPAPAAAARVAQTTFEVVLIDDSTDRVVVAPDAELPEGVTLFEEHVTWSRVEAQPDLHSVLLSPRADESLALALARLEPWLHAFPLPPGARFGWEQAPDAGDHATAAPAVKRWRSLILRGAPVLTTSDIVNVTNSPTPESGPAITIELYPDARERFRVATRDHIRERIAILLDGVIESAPIIQSEIRGGQLQLRLGRAHDPADVERLIESLRAAK